uniref:Borealin C-terminal domain-containing protein n=1 Tax=Cacopsylla melanoneura TaxID=428564 RepID=A0A8D8YYD8_9HEMI
MKWSSTKKIWKANSKCGHQNVGLKSLTIQDFLDMTDRAEKHPEYQKALQAVLDGTYVPPPTPSVVDSNKTASSALSSGISVMSSMSGSQHNRFLHPSCSSTSSVRSLYSKQGAPHMGSSHRSRSAIKTVNGGQPGSGMKRRSMSQPTGTTGSVRKAHQDVYSASQYGRTPIITPKVHPDTSSTVLRLPKTGENLYSLGGSPVLANALASSSTAPQALIPLRDGRMLAILPTERNTMDRPMDFSPETKHNLILLKQNLNFLIDDDEMKPMGKR